MANLISRYGKPLKHTLRGGRYVDHRLECLCILLCIVSPRKAVSALHFATLTSLCRMYSISSLLTSPSLTCRRRPRQSAPPVTGIQVQQPFPLLHVAGRPGSRAHWSGVSLNARGGFLGRFLHHTRLVACRLSSTATTVSTSTWVFPESDFAATLDHGLLSVVHGLDAAVSRQSRSWREL